MFIIDTLVAFSKLVAMRVIINVKQRLFKRYAVYRYNLYVSRLLEKSWKSQGISCGLESGHPADIAPTTALNFTWIKKCEITPRVSSLVAFD